MSNDARPRRMFVLQDHVADKTRGPVTLGFGKGHRNHADCPNWTITRRVVPRIRGAIFRCGDRPWNGLNGVDGAGITPLVIRDLLTFGLHSNPGVPDLELLDVPEGTEERIKPMETKRDQVHGWTSRVAEENCITKGFGKPAASWAIYKTLFTNSIVTVVAMWYFDIGANDKVKTE